jgi:hypothetical protein
MKPIQWNQDQSLLSAPLLTVTAVQAYVLIRGRNAWNSTWVQNYKGTGAVHLTLAEAKNAAEAQRVQGSVFYIRQVPALALNSSEGTVLLVEFHSDNCFGKWDAKKGAEKLLIGTPMDQVITVLGRCSLWKAPVPSIHSFIAVKAEWDVPETMPARASFKRWVSDSVGPKYYLNWSEYPSDKSRGGVNAIIRAFGKINEAGALSEAEKEFTGLSEQWNRTLTPEETAVMLNEMESFTSEVEAALALETLFAQFEEVSTEIAKARQEDVQTRPTLRLIQGGLNEDFEPKEQDPIEGILAVLTSFSPAQPEV